jgi:hypothetical protein
VALTTYSELKASVADFLNRTDLTSTIPDFIALAEADINSHFDLRTVESDQALTAVTNSRFIALPTGFREPQNLWINWSYGRGDPLRFVAPELLVTSVTPGIPLLWCIDGTNIAFDRPAGSNYSLTLRMIGGVTLSDATPTNLVLTNYPNVYLYGALKEAAPYLRDAEGAGLWEAKYQDAIMKAKAKEGREKSLVTLSTEPGSLTFRGNRSGFNINRGF